jgi:phage terminase small subunit
MMRAPFGEIPYGVNQQSDSERTSMLNPQQQKFVQAYMKAGDGNATAAAIKAGYSKKTAYAQGSRLLKHVEVRKALEGPIKKASDKLELTAERVLQELSRLAFFDIRKLVDNTGRPKALSELDDDTAAAIVGLDVVNVGSEQAGGVGEVLKFKIADKKGALDLSMRYLKLLTDKVEVTGKDGAPLDPIGNEAARRIAFILSKGLRAQKG